MYHHHYHALSTPTKLSPMARIFVPSTRRPKCSHIHPAQFWPPQHSTDYIAPSDFVPFLGDPLEHTGYVAIPPNFGPPRMQGSCMYVCRYFLLWSVFFALIDHSFLELFSLEIVIGLADMVQPKESEASDKDPDAANAELYNETIENIF